MLASFESRLLDLLSDALEGVSGVHQVGPARDGRSAPGGATVAITVRVLSGLPEPSLGDDALRPEGTPGDWRLRPSLSLSGNVLVELEVGSSTTPLEQQAQRAVHLSVLDRVLLALHAEAVRNGSGFDTGEDQGFALQGFRLERVESLSADATDFHRFRIFYRYTGRFWPVEPAIEGDAIILVASRLALLRAALPQGLRVRSGQDDLNIPVRLDLRDWGGGVARLVARLSGAAPPGELVGSTSGVPAGNFSYPPGADGTFVVVYRPPPTLVGSARARILLRLAHPGRVSLELGEIVVEVQP